MIEFLVRESSTIREALIKIEKTHKGYVFVVDKDDRVLGSLTDGDIRRALMAGGTLDCLVTSACNQNFVKASKHDSRNTVINQLENGITAIPIVDENGVICDIATRDAFNPPKEGTTYSRSISPVRVTFCGGGSDVYTHFAKHDGSALNATIDLFCHATLRKRADYKIHVTSFDLGEAIYFESLDDLNKYEGTLSLITSTLKVLKPGFGFELEIRSDFPVGSGLGGSSAVVAAILGCFNEFKVDKLTKFELAELAYQAERLVNGTAGGWQDQYATIFGGFNYQLYSPNENTIMPLRLQRRIKLELQERLILCFSNIKRPPDAVRKIFEKNGKTKEDNLKLNAAMVRDMIAAVSREQWAQVAMLFNKGWELKRSSNDNISNPVLDNYFDTAFKNGAVAGKLLGAGSGGHLLFLTSGRERLELSGALESEGLRIVPFKFFDEGLTSWSGRDL